MKSSEKDEEKKRKRPFWKMFKTLLPFFWPKDSFGLRMRVVMSFVLLVLSQVATVSSPIVYRDLVNALTNPTTVPITLLILFISLRFISTNLDQARDAVFYLVGAGVTRNIAVKSFSHIHTLSLRFHLNKSSGGVLKSLDRGVGSISSIMELVVFDLGSVFVQVVLISSVFVAAFDAWLSLVSIVAVVLYVTFTVIVTEWRTKFRRAMNDVDNDMSAKATDSLLNFEAVKTFVAEKFETKRYDICRKNYIKAGLQAQYSLYFLNSGQSLTLNVAAFVGLFLAAKKMVDGGGETQKMSIGDFVAVNMFMTQLFAPLNWLGTMYRMIVRALTDMESLFDLWEENPEICDQPGAQDLVLSGGEIIFDDIWFAYPENPNQKGAKKPGNGKAAEAIQVSSTDISKVGSAPPPSSSEEEESGEFDSLQREEKQKERAVLKGVSFQVPKGKMVAIVGPTGSGKSTVLRLLLRLYDPLSGQIKIDGQPIHQVTQDSVRKAIGIVPQDIMLFNESIGFNIAYGDTELLARAEANQLLESKKKKKKEISDDLESGEMDQMNRGPNFGTLVLDQQDQTRIISAAQKCHVESFIESLPNQYGTLVGERGMKLSGGEKQRIGLARAVLKNAPIMCLDEATSSLDTRTERLIKESLDVMKGKTTLVVAHRLSTIVDADEIVVLKSGQVAERGTHAQLVQLGGEYAKMWAAQAQASGGMNLLE